MNKWTIGDYVKCHCKDSIGQLQITKYFAEHMSYFFQQIHGKKEKKRQGCINQMHCLDFLWILIGTKQLQTHFSDEWGKLQT